MNLNLFSFLTFACLHDKLVRKEAVFYGMFVHDMTEWVSDLKLDPRHYSNTNNEKKFLPTESLYTFIYQDLSPVFYSFL